MPLRDVVPLEEEKEEEEEEEYLCINKYLRNIILVY